MEKRRIQKRVRSKFPLLEKYVREYWEKNGRAPGLTEISAALDLPLTTVHRTVARMKEEGIFSGDGTRNLRTGNSAPAGMLPLVGSIVCGPMREAEQDILGYYPLPDEIFGSTQDCFLLRADGMSMKNAGIFDGDLVLVKRQQCADEGQIVVAVHNNRATLKYYYPDTTTKRVILRPANPDYDDIIIEPDSGDTFLIQGVVRKAIRNFT